MGKQRMAGFFLALACFIGCCFTPVFIASILKDQQTGNLEAFEWLARIIGYALVLAIDTLTAVSAYRAMKQGAWRRTAGLALLLSTIMVVMLCVHDVLLFDAYGNQLEGTFSMAAFFAMDAALLALYPIGLFLFRKQPEKPALYRVLIAIAFVWALYMVGDMAGYPAAQITDWDEMMIKCIPLYHVLAICFLSRTAAIAQGICEP